jgi:hypothetical protein
MRKDKKNLLKQQSLATNSCTQNNGVAYNPYPKAQTPGVVVPIPNGTRIVNSNYAIDSKMELPAYMCTDQYGRVYQADVFYGTLPCHAPVPIPMPEQITQIEPIVLSVQDNRRYN